VSAKIELGFDLVAEFLNPTPQEYLFIYIVLPMLLRVDVYNCTTLLYAKQTAVESSIFCAGLIYFRD